MSRSRWLELIQDMNDYKKFKKISKKYDDDYLIIYHMLEDRELEINALGDLVDTLDEELRSREDLVQEFNEAFNIPVGLDIGDPNNRSELQLQVHLIDEEVEELYREYRKFFHGEPSASKENLLKELCDLQYVISGLAVRFGLNLDEAFKEVHKSNMSKLDKEGKPIYNKNGKVMKSDQYKPADMRKFV